ncbi:MAG: hypothetical protein KBG45_00005, partial [Ottowia sp.]|nr:hypothetical protein [Ottowia sp.]
GLRAADPGLSDSAAVNRQVHVMRELTTCERLLRRDTTDYNGSISASQLDEQSAVDRSLSSGPAPAAT